MDPVYTYDKTKGWVISTGVEILAERDGFIVVDLADVPGGKGVRRGYAPWHPDYTQQEHNGNGIAEALQRGLSDCAFEVIHHMHERGRHVCAVRKENYHKLVVYVPAP